MKKEIIEWLGLSGVIAVLVVIPWTKMMLGAFLTVLGAFYPHSSADKARGEGRINATKHSALFKGSLRVGVVLAGLFLIFTALFDGINAAIEEDRRNPPAEHEKSGLRKSIEKAATESTKRDKEKSLKNGR